MQTPTDTRQAGGSERLRELARDVCAFDWSDNDDDAVATIARLRAELEALASPQGAEQRQEGRTDGSDWLDYAVTPEEKAMREAHFARIDAQAATQGDAVALRIGSTRCYGDEWFRELTYRGVTFLAPLDGEDKARHALLSSPPGVQAAQVSGAPRADAYDSWQSIAADMQRIDRLPQVNHPPLSYWKSRVGALAAIAHPGSAAHGGEVSDA